jgi:speckle-type POZ protein
MRSPVFKAELFGEMRESGTAGCITVGDMQPAVFEALLHFIYTDSLPPAMDCLGGNDYKEMTRHLVVAADRYAMKRLKIICESILCETVDVKTVMTTLALADQHHCGRLKDACIKFIASLGTREIDCVMASKGYVELKATSPSALVELWEKTSRIRNSKPSLHMLV